MERSTTEPSASLRPYFSAYHFIEGDEAKPARYPVKAGPKAAIARVYSGGCRVEREGLCAELPPLSLIGPVLNAYRVSFPPGWNYIAIAEFTETGCFEYLGAGPGEAADSFMGLSVPVRERAPRHDQDSRLETGIGSVGRDGAPEKMAEPEGKAAELERCLLGLAGVLGSPSLGEAERAELVRSSSAIIKEDVDAVKVATLASDLGVSVRTLERSYRIVTGLTPKQYIDLVKFTKLFHLYFEDGETFAEAFYKSSYYDQSHVIKKFRRFAGFSPARAMKKPFQFSSGLSSPFARELV